MTKKQINEKEVVLKYCLGMHGWTEEDYAKLLKKDVRTIQGYIKEPDKMKLEYVAILTDGIILNAEQMKILLTR